MARYREVSSISLAEAGYIAGLVDGEGTVTLSRKHAGETRQLVISISNTEAPILEYVLKTVGAGKITRKRTTAAHHTPSLTYAIWNRQALSLLIQIEPFLQSYKGQRARLIIADYVRLTPRNGRYTDAASTARVAFAEAVLAIRPTTPGMGRNLATDQSRLKWVRDEIPAANQYSPAAAQSSFLS